MKDTAAEEKSENMRDRTLQTSGSVKGGQKVPGVGAAHGEDPAETGCLLHPVEDPMLEQVDVPEESCDSALEQVCWQDL